MINGKSGFVVRSGNDPDEIAVRIIELLDDAAARQEMGTQGYERIRDELSIERMGQSFPDLYDSMLRSGFRVTAVKHDICG